MSHVTPEQAKRLKELGMFNQSLRKQNLCIDKVPDDLLFYPSAEELMEWLKNEIELLIMWHEGEWVIADHRMPPETPFAHSTELIDALYLAACLVLEQKNLAP